MGTFSWLLPALGGGIMAVTVQWPLLSSQEWAQLTQRLELTPRQAEIVQHLLLGKSDKQIARELSISVPTVRTHMGRLFQKLGLRDRIELILHVFACLRESTGITSETR
jgi:DNA-binding NarL/FixJ family response regulator